jgi:hypothetical protein
MENELRQMFEMKGTDMSVSPTLSPELRNRVGRQRIVMGGLVVAAAFALVLGGLAVRTVVSTDAAPVPPAEEGKQEIEPMRNGHILNGDVDDTYWLGTTAPPPPGGDQTYHWHAFDQETGSFLYAAQPPVRRVWVVGEDGLIAQINCPPSVDCDTSEALGYVSATEMAIFGPGPDEITVPSGDGRSVHVIGFDGTLRDTLDISAVFSEGGQDLVDLAWSPDGNRLAVSTEFRLTTQCGPNSDPCGRVWILDRVDSEPQPVYTERTSEYGALRDLAWSPDGDTLALLQGQHGGLCEGMGQAWPRLVALRVTSDESVHAETLNVYDDYTRGPNRRREKGCNLPHHYHLAYPFAWSPDGKRIAVTRDGGIAEISAENGEVLARHPAADVEGPLAWLPKR